jgi:hypothetical protein
VKIQYVQTDIDRAHSLSLALRTRSRIGKVP